MIYSTINVKSKKSAQDAKYETETSHIQQILKVIGKVRFSCIHLTPETDKGWELSSIAIWKDFYFLIFFEGKLNFCGRLQKKIFQKLFFFFGLPGFFSLFSPRLFREFDQFPDSFTDFQTVCKDFDILESFRTIRIFYCSFESIQTAWFFPVNLKTSIKNEYFLDKLKYTKNIYKNQFSNTLRSGDLFGNFIKDTRESSIFLKYQIMFG